MLKHADFLVLDGGRGHKITTMIPPEGPEGLQTSFLPVLIIDFVAFELEETFFCFSIIFLILRSEPNLVQL